MNLNVIRISLRCDSFPSTCQIERKLAIFPSHQLRVRYRKRHTHAAELVPAHNDTHTIVTKWEIIMTCRKRDNHHAHSTHAVWRIKRGNSLFPNVRAIWRTPDQNQRLSILQIIQRTHTHTQTLSYRDNDGKALQFSF